MLFSSFICYFVNILGTSKEPIRMLELLINHESYQLTCLYVFWGLNENPAGINLFSLLGAYHNYKSGGVLVIIRCDYVIFRQISLAL